MGRKINNDTMSERQFILAVCLLIFGCGMLLAGFIVAPIGQIHSSILAVFGEICTIAGGILGINFAFRNKEDKIREELYMTDEKNEDTDR